MADPPPVFRNDFEARAPDIVLLLDALIPPRFNHLRSFDYTDPSKMTFTGLEAAGGRLMTFVLREPNKVSAKYVSRELPKAIAAHDEGA